MVFLGLSTPFFCIWVGAWVDVYTVIPGAGCHWSEEAVIRKVEVLNGANVQGLEQYEEEWSVAGGTPKSTTSAASFSSPDVPVSRTGTQESSD